MILKKDPLNNKSGSKIKSLQDTCSPVFAPIVEPLSLAVFYSFPTASELLDPHLIVLEV